MDKRIYILSLMFVFACLAVVGTALRVLLVPS